VRVDDGQMMLQSRVSRAVLPADEFIVNPVWNPLDGSVDWARRSRHRLGRLLSLQLLANHYPPLHGLRFLAIVLVLNVHVAAGMKQARFYHKPAVANFFHHMFFGMDLFFILSGFLIGMVLLHSFEKRRSKRGIFRFYIRRSMRTFPLYYIVLALLVFVTPLSFAQGQNLVREILYATNYGYATANTRVMLWGWSLSMEEHFYLAAPFFIIALHFLKTHAARITLMALLWLAGPLIRLGIYLEHMGDWTGPELFQNLYIKTHTRFDILIAGILLAYVQHYFAAGIKRLFLKFWIRATCWMLSAGFLSVLILRPPILGDIALFKVFAWGTFTSLMYVPLILLLLNAGGWIQRFLSARIFLKFATLGYGIYLLHLPIFQIIFPLGGIAVRRFGVPVVAIWPSLLILLLLTSAAVAYVLHLLVEKPAIRLRDKIAA
jgi:peptidoglycan/LPS O-acetylase OafA/YrhL